MKLRNQIGGGYGFVLILLSIISLLSYYQLDSIINDYNEVVIKEKDIALKSSNVLIELLDMHRNEKDFISMQDSSYINIVNFHHRESVTHLEDIKELTSSSEIINIVDEIELNLENYKEHFDKLVADIFLLGLTENVGLYGQFRNYIRDFEVEVGGNSIDGIMINYLNLRRNEKDYLLRYDLNYLEGVLNDVSMLRKNVRNSALQNNKKNKLLSLIGNYERDFKRYVTIDLNKLEQLELLEITSNEIILLCEKIISITAVNTQLADSEIIAETDMAKTILIIISVFAIGLSLIFSQFITSKITSSMDVIIETASLIGEKYENEYTKFSNVHIDHLTKNLSKYTSEELRSLSTSIQAMINRVRNWNKELEESVDKRTEELNETNTVLVKEVKKRNKAENQLATLNASLLEKNVELEQIVYISSHDLRSPLVNIGGFGKEIKMALNELVEVVDKIELSDSDREKLLEIVNDDILDSFTYIDTSIKKMDMLLNGLLSISRLGRMDFNREIINSETLIKEILDSFEYEIKNNDVAINVDKLNPCYGDAAQLNQLFSNLISNSLKYRDKNKESEISVQNYIENDRVIFSIQDNGIGIKKEHKNKVFDIFHRLNPKETKGEGLGLAIVKKILNKHDGKIWMESEEGKGTTFYVSLPYI